jgi:predicted 2-oxoglutarate/Fe(II)-dependent dioxygenase YbiX
VRIFIADHAMDDATCRAVQAAMDAGASEPTEILEDDIHFAEDVRRASHIEVPDTILDLVGACLDGQREAIAAFFGRPLRSREGLSLLRYETGGFYKPHVDRAEMPSWPAAADREVTVVLFLDSSRDDNPQGGFSGGLLRIFPGGPDAAPVEIVPNRGTLVAFPSNMRHEVTAVMSGRRDTAVDWLRESEKCEGRSAK